MENACPGLGRGVAVALMFALSLAIPFAAIGSDHRAARREREVVLSRQHGGRHVGPSAILGAAGLWPRSCRKPTRREWKQGGEALRQARLAPWSPWTASTALSLSAWIRRCIKDRRYFRASGKVLLAPVGHALRDGPHAHR